MESVVSGQSPMGMFDNLTMKMPLEIELGVDHRDHVFQTKSFDCRLDDYEVRKTGTLWRKAYDVADRSDPTKEGLTGLAGCMTRINEKWDHLSGFSGECVFYTLAAEIAGEIPHDVPYRDRGWLEVLVLFKKGHVIHQEIVNFREPLLSC